MMQQELEQLSQDAAEGQADSQYRLAMLYIYGNGVPEDNDLAFELLQKAAVQNHIEAKYNLAICYHYGYGTAVDLKKAFSLYLACANAGHGKSMELVGRFYHRGIYVLRDRERAKYWLSKAMQSGDIDAIREAEKEINIQWDCPE